MLYLNRYKKLIAHYSNVLSEGYVEKHHVIPKCMGGDDSKDNIVILPARAHFIAHYLLYKAYPENRSLAHAFAMMAVSNKYQSRSSKLYEQSKVARSNALTGVSRPEWVKEKLRKPKSTTVNYKKPKSKEHAEAISAALKGKKKSKTAIENNVKARKAYFDELKESTERKKEYYRNLFLECKMSRKEFYEKHSSVSLSTLKRYLSGL